MAIYKICDIRFDIQARYDYTHKLCAAYAADGPADFTIRIPEEKLREAVAAAPQYPPGYHEGLEVYREISSLVPFRDAFLMHSSVVALHGEAYVFTAKSGTGKSTHSRLWLAHFPEAEIVNGDKPLFKKTDGAFYAYGTPWCGKENWGKNDRARIKAVCFLSQAKENSIAPMTKKEVISRIFEQVYLPASPEGAERVMTLLDEFVSTVNFYHLHCNISDEAVGIAYEAMKG